MDDLFSMAMPFIKEYGGKAVSWLANRIFKHPKVQGMANLISSVPMTQPNPATIT